MIFSLPIKVAFYLQRSVYLKIPIMKLEFQRIDNVVWFFDSLV